MVAACAGRSGAIKREHTMLTTNVGGIDRILRIVVGAALILWFFLDQGTGFWHWAKLIGIVPLATGLMSTCPLYTVLGLSTCPMKKA
jgi:Protein of unknown function (DUF2892)